MSIGNLKDQGNKGNNFPYQLRSLQLLGAIEDCCSTSGGTLLSILAAIQGGQNFAQALVEDQGGTGCPTNCPVYTEVKIWNGTSFDPPIYYAADGSVVTPVGPLVYINPDYHLAQIVQLLTPQATRVHHTISATGSGTVPVSLRGSVINVGNSAGTWNGISLPAGVSIPWDAIANRDTYGTISYNATGTTFIIEYTT